VYGEDVFDLLDERRRSLPLREDTSGLTVCGLRVLPVTSTASALSILSTGTIHRTTASTLMNTSSSRSHAVFTVYLEREVGGAAKDTSNTDKDANDDANDKNNDTNEIGLSSKVTSRLTFVDLAGSERMKKTGAEGSTMKEGIQINIGLLALGNVINALGISEEKRKDGAHVHVPYRQSKLTRLLQEALGGNSQTLFLAHVSPSSPSLSETLSTLSYASRARFIKNAPVRNLDERGELGRVRGMVTWLKNELVRVRFGIESIKTAPEQGSEEVATYLKDLDRRLASEYGLAPNLPSSSGGGFTSVSSSLLLPPPPSSNSAGGGPSCASEDVFEGEADEDMKILDQLMELQQSDTAFQATTTLQKTELADVQKDIDEQEGLLLELRRRLEGYHSMKGKYEVMVSEISSLESSKSSLASQLAALESSPPSSDTTSTSLSLKSKLLRVEENLSKAREETRKMRGMYKRVEEEARKCGAMERKISELKSGKVSLMKLQKETVNKHRTFTEKKTREIQGLKRKGRQQGKNLSKMEIECQKQKKALDRRTQYCQKITSKLKQTETHLMRLLSMRKRELEKFSSANTSSINGAATANDSNPASRRASRRISYIPPPTAHTLSTATPTFAPRSQEVTTCSFLLSQFVSDRVEDVENREAYDRAVGEYRTAMGEMVAEVERLKELKVSASNVGEDGVQSDDFYYDEMNPNYQGILESETRIEELELKLSLAGATMEDLRARMGSQFTHATTGEDLETTAALASAITAANSSTLKLVGDLTAPVCRTVLLEVLGEKTDGEIERRRLEKDVVRKDAALRDCEEVIAGLQSKLATLSAPNPSSASSNNMDLLKTTAENNAALKTENSDLLAKIASLEESLSELTSTSADRDAKLSSLLESSSLARASEARAKVSAKASEFLVGMQERWKKIGVGYEEREKKRKEMENCVETKCESLLKEAVDLSNSTTEEIERLISLSSMMESALAVPTPKPKLTHRSSRSGSNPTLLEQLDISKNRHDATYPQYVKAKEKKSKIISDITSILKSMEATASSTLSPPLQSFLETGFTSPDSLSSSHFTEIGSEVRKLRVLRSSMLAKNNDAYTGTHKLAKETHLTSGEVFELCDKFFKKSPPAEGWFDLKICKEVCEFICKEDMKVGTSEVWHNHVVFVRDAIETVASSRRVFSEVLTSEIEKAHGILMSVVEGELEDPKEMYKSFHEALFRLPKLSRERIKACVRELGILVGAAETMTQSEAEAVTVVWDALDLKSKERGKFWGECEAAVGLVKSSSGNGIFDKILVSESQGKLEDWMEELLKEARSTGHDLEVKLAKLEAIHKEVERKRAKQEGRSRIMGLESEIRILAARLTDFENKANNKERLVSKKSSSGLLLKEEKFRKQMQGKFGVKLDRLAAMLKEWEEREGCEFDYSILSEEVRDLMTQERTAFMHLRMSRVPRRKSGEEVEEEEAKVGKEKGKDEQISPPAPIAPPPPPLEEKVKVKAKSSSTSRAKESKPGRKEKMKGAVAAAVEAVAVLADENDNNNNNINTKKNDGGKDKGDVGYSSPPRVTRRSTRARKSTLLPFGTILTPAKP